MRHKYQRACTITNCLLCVIVGIGIVFVILICGQSSWPHKVSACPFVPGLNTQKLPGHCDVYTLLYGHVSIFRTWDFSIHQRSYVIYVFTNMPNKLRSPWTYVLGVATWTSFVSHNSTWWSNSTRHYGAGNESCTSPFFRAEGPIWVGAFTLFQTVFVNVDS